jgi:hypothetical protein
LAALAVAAARAQDGAPPVISWDDAEGHVGEEVTVEGTIVATHASPLSTLLGFEPTFNRFTAVIQAADRGAFDPAPEERYRGKRVRVTGRIEEYEKKPEIVLRSPAQIRVLDREKPSEEASQESKEEAALAELTAGMVARLTEIETRMISIEERLDRILAAIEQGQRAAPSPVYVLPGQLPESEPPPRPAYEALRTIKQGMSAAQVQQLAGQPAFVDQTSEGGQIWYFGGGRSVSFDRRGRVRAFSGFER